MKKPKRKQLYRKAVDKWGLNLQFIMFMEECSELIKAVSKYMRLANESAQPIRILAEEIADVEIMIEQFKTILSFEQLEKRVNTAKHDKLLKLKNILEPFPTSNNKGENK